MVDDDDIGCCERALQDFHKCTPTYIESVPVQETLKDNTRGKASFMFSESGTAPRPRKPTPGRRW